MSRSIHFLNLLAILALAALPAAATPVTYGPGVSLNAQQQAIVDYMATTSGQGRPFMYVDPILTQVAQAAAESMGTEGYYAETTPQGYGANYLVAQAGYQLPAGWTDPVSNNYLESIDASYASASDTWNAWLNSPPHKVHVLGQSSFYASETSVGVGYANVPGSPYTYYWVVITAPPNLAPSLTISAPANGANVTVDQVTVTGTTGTTTPAASVRFRVVNAAGTGDFQTANGTANWNGAATLAPGPNTIEVQSLDGSGNLQLAASRTVYYIEQSTLTVTVAGNGTVTKGYLGTSTRNVGFKQTITATATDGSIFAGWSGSSTSASATISFLMTENAALTATFAPNPFLTRTGGYTSILTGTDAGLLSVTVGSTGAFTGKVVVDGVAHVIHGVLAVGGTATVSIARTKNTPLVVTLALDVTGTTGITGTVTDGANSSTFAAAAAYNKSAGKFAAAGTYTVSLPPDSTNTDPSLPQGNGYGLLTINTLGHASLTGALADGTPFSVAGTISQDNTFSVYTNLYTAKGSLSGTLTLEPTSVSDLDGTLHWSKPAIATSKANPEAIEEDLPTVASQYVRPAHGATVVQVSATSNNAQLNLGAGNLTQPVAQPATLETTNVIVLPTPSLPGLHASVNTLTGRFSGSFVHPVTKTVTAFHGVIYQKANAAYGYFLGASESGYTSFVAVE